MRKRFSLSLCLLALLLVSGVGVVSAKAPFAIKSCAKNLPKGVVCVPGGLYMMGSNRNAQSRKSSLRAEYPKHYVWLQTYYVDKYEITNKEYLACMKAGHCKPPSYYARLGGSMWRRFRHPRHPFVRADWTMARDYCRYVGKRLLSEAEWEAAARGKKGDTYPWGNSKPDCSKANYRTQPPHTSYPPSRKMRFCGPAPNDGSKIVKKGRDGTWPVDAMPTYRGIVGMAGNGYEWIQDHYDPHAYAHCKKDSKGRCVRIQPIGPCKSNKVSCTVKRNFAWRWVRRKVRVTITRRGRKRRVTRYKYVRVKRTYRRARRFTFKRHMLKGGSWWWYADRMRASYRRHSNAFTRNHRLSIRCGSSSPTSSTLSPRRGAAKRFNLWWKRMLSRATRSYKAKYGKR